MFEIKKEAIPSVHVLHDHPVMSLILGIIGDPEDGFARVDNLEAVLPETIKVDFCGTFVCDFRNWELDLEELVKVVFVDGRPG